MTVMSMKDKIFKEKGFTNTPLGVPSASGVYVICVVKKTNTFPCDFKAKKVVYIGVAKNINKRLKHQNHIYRRLWNILKNYLPMVFYLECENYLDVEKTLIKKYKPRFNIQHNK